METEIREALIEFVNAPFAAAFPGIPLPVDNAPFDWNNPPPKFVDFSIEFMGADQVGMAADPQRRERGYVYVTLYAREGLGWRATSVPKDWFAEKLKFQRVGIANLEEPQPDGSARVKGFYTESLKVPFFTDPA